MTDLPKIMSIFLFPSEIDSFGKNKAVFFYFVTEPLTHSFWRIAVFFFRRYFLTGLPKIMGISLFPSEIDSFCKNKAVFFYFVTEPLTHSF